METWDTSALRNVNVAFSVWPDAVTLLQMRAETVLVEPKAAGRTPTERGQVVHLQSSVNVHVSKLVYKYAGETLPPSSSLWDQASPRRCSMTSTLALSRGWC